jgi:ESCRT-I complex subunit TSG101
MAQNNALRTAQATLTHELSQLSDLDNAISTNETLLRDAMAQADAVIRDAAHRKRPNIDDVLVPPFVAHKQLYEVVAEGKACEDARQALGRALDRGRVGAETWVRQMRAVGREEFLKKTLARKIAIGLGLDVGAGGWADA